MRSELSRWWELDLLIDRHCEGLLTREEAVRLEILLCGDREARRRFLAALYLDGAMRWEGAVGAAAPFPTGLEGEGPAIVCPEDEVPQPTTPREELPWMPWLDMWEQTVCYLTRPTLVAIVVGMICTTLLLIGILYRPAGPGMRRMAARLTSTVDCRWADEAAFRPQIGAPLAIGDELRIASGMARLTFQRGATLVLEGPARFVIQSDNAGRLYQGQLMAEVPPSATGFAVEAPGGKVVDYGTVFLIGALAGEAAEVHVIEGLVETERLNGWRATGEKCRVTKGLAARFSRMAGGTTVFPASKARFSAITRLAAGVVRTGEKIRFEDEIPAALFANVLEDNAVIRVFRERRQVVLKEPLEVLVPNSDEDGRVKGRRETLAAGTRVDSYLLHYDAEVNQREANPMTSSGSITFDRPVLGVIAEDGQLAATDELLGNAQTKYVDPEGIGRSRGVELDAEGLPDAVQLKADRRRVFVKCHNGSPTTDQMRILVASEGD